jgi:hypothetical protein
MTVKELRKELSRIKDQDSKVEIHPILGNNTYNIEGEGPPINSLGNIKGEKFNEKLHEGAGLLVVEKRRPFLPPSVVIYGCQ